MLIFHEHKDIASRCPGPLTRRDEPCDAYRAALAEVGKTVGRDGPEGQRILQQRERMELGREAEHAVLGDHPIGGLEVGKGDPRVGVLERELGLRMVLAPTRALVVRLGAEPEARLPEQLAPRQPESTEAADPDKVFYGGALESYPELRVVFAEDVEEADTDFVALIGRLALAVPVIGRLHGQGQVLVKRQPQARFVADDLT